MTPSAAKAFLIRRIEQQAKREGVSLSPVETRMLEFSEAYPFDGMWAVAEQFESQCDEAAYEQKIVSLVSNSFGADRESVAASASGRKHSMLFGRWTST
jgi:hypothetical protein